MSEDDIPLQRLERGSEGHTKRLNDRMKEIAEKGAAMDARMAEEAGITIEELHTLFGLHAFADVKRAIEVWGGTFRSHIGEQEYSQPPPREGPEIGGWMGSWESGRDDLVDEMHEKVVGSKKNGGR